MKPYKQEEVEDLFAQLRECALSRRMTMITMREVERLWTTIDALYQRLDALNRAQE